MMKGIVSHCHADLCMPYLRGMAYIFMLLLLLLLLHFQVPTV